MSFQPVKQISSILHQEYFESTISWSLRVVLALNVPLIVLPFWTDFSFGVVWAAFGAYMLALIDYRGPHARKITIQSVEAALMFIAAVIGMNTGSSIVLSVVTMFFIGLCAALIRNWSTYGSSIGVAVGFFFLFGLATPQPFEISLRYGAALLLGAGWSIIITLVSFPLQPSNPVKRSVARIWKANTEFLDAIVQQLASGEEIVSSAVTEKEIAVRAAINQSRELFGRRRQTDKKAHHYDIMMDIRHTASLFGATITSLHEELPLLDAPVFSDIKTSVAYKTISSFAQAGARVAIVIFTMRPEDLMLARMRVTRAGIALQLFNEACQDLALQEKERMALAHFTHALSKAHEYLELSISQISDKLKLSKSHYLENYVMSFHNFLSGLKANTLMAFWNDMVNINSQQFKYALRVALALSIGVFIFRFFHINHGHWISLTILIVIQPYYGATVKKGTERIVGTVAGIVLGGLVMLLPMPHWAFVAMLVVVSFFVAYFLRNNYKIGVFFVTVMMVVLMQISQQATWQLIGWRVLSTMIGALLAVVAGYAFWPMWERQRFPSLMTAALAANKLYLRQVIRYLNHEPVGDDTWGKRRRAAEAANNDVFSCVQRMYQEPQHIRQEVNSSYALVGANIRISREITSIALLLEQNRSHQQAEMLRAYDENVAQVFDVLGQRISAAEPYPLHVSFGTIKGILSGLSFGQDGQLRFARNELEKIVFELEAMCLLLTPKEDRAMA